MNLRFIYKSLRQNALFNSVVRIPLRFLYYAIPALNKFVFRWRVSGIIDVAVAGKKFRFFAKADDGIADALFYNAKGYEEFSDLVLFCSVASKSRIILDIGANTGIFSVASGATNPAAHVYAFEPYPVNASRLKKNISLNKLENISVIEKAAGDHADLIEFTVPDDDRICDVTSANRSFSEKYYKGQITYKSIKVQQVSIDDMVRELKLPSVDLIKIDVEGYEMAVFKGAAATLKRFSPVIICEIFADAQKEVFYDEFLHPMGYHFYQLLPSGLLYIEKIFNHPESRNFLFTKKKLPQPFTVFSEVKDIGMLLTAQQG